MVGPPGILGASVRHRSLAEGSRANLEPRSAANEKATPRIPEVAFLDTPIADTQFAGF